MADIEEIVKKGRRITESLFTNLSDRNLQGGPSAAGIEGAPPASDEDDDETIDEIVVTGVAATTARGQLAGRVAAQSGAEFAEIVGRSASPFQQLLKKPSTILQPIDEIVVTAKRAAPRALSSAARFTLGSALLEIGARLGSAIADDVSQARLDQALRTTLATGVKRSMRDTKLRVQKPALDEIKVVAKRLPQRKPRDFKLPRRVFEGTTRPDFRRPKPAPVQKPTFQRPKINRPDAPSVKRPQRVSAKTPKLRTITQFFDNPTLPALPTGFTDPFARLLSQPSTRTLPQPDLTQPNPGLVGSNQPRQSPGTKLSPFAILAGQCPPCSKRTRKQKQRTKCYRKLVKEKRNPANDIEYKWTEINCDTGKEI